MTMMRIYAMNTLCQKYIIHDLLKTMSISSKGYLLTNSLVWPTDGANIVLRSLTLINNTVPTQTNRMSTLTSTSTLTSMPTQSIMPNRNFSTTQSLLKDKPNYPDLLESELEEDFVQGSGPGGQSVNRTMNCVVLRHKPTGLVVKCHETRSLDMNRQRARQRLQARLDFHYHGEQSYVSQKKHEYQILKKEKKRRSKIRLEKKRAFKEREGLLNENDDNT